MTPFWTLLMLGALVGFVLSSLAFGAIWMVRTLLKKLRPWVLLMDEEGGVGYHGRGKVKDGHLIMGKDDDIKRFPIRVEARCVTNDGIVYTLGKQTGANLRVPRTASIRRLLDAEPEAQIAFDVVDPGLLGRTYARRMAQETVDSQTEKEDWRKGAIVPVLIFATVVIVGLLVVIGKMAG